MLTTSSYVLAMSPPPSLPSSPDSNPTSIAETLGSTPRAILDRMMTLSTAFALEDELTPVQAWNRIQAHIQLGALKVDRLQSLVGRMAVAVKCHGYVLLLRV